jgi:hypothetical protein
LLCRLAPDGESDFLKIGGLRALGEAADRLGKPKENESPWASNRRIARIFLDAAHDDLERPGRERPLQLRPSKPFAAHS